MSRDIRDVLAGASPDVTTRPNLAEVRRVVRVRRRVRAAGTAVTLAGVIAVGVAGLPWLGEQINATPEPAQTPTGTPAPTNSETRTPAPEPTPDDQTTEPVTSGTWGLVGTPKAFDVDGWSEVRAAVTVDDTTVAVGAIWSDPEREFAEPFARPAAWRDVGEDDWERIDDVAVPDGVDLDSWSLSMDEVVQGDDGSLIAVGNASGQGQSIAVAWRSTDLGESWDVAKIDGSPASHAFDATWAGDRFIAVGLSEPVDSADAPQVPAIWSSTNGLQWERRDLPDHPLLAGAAVADDPSRIIFPALESVAWSPPTGVVVAGMVSVDEPPDPFTITGPAEDDPSTWTVTETLTIDSLVATSDGIYANVTTARINDQRNAAVITSQDGINWEPVPGTDLSTPFMIDNILVTADGAIVAAGVFAYVQAMLWHSSEEFHSEPTEADTKIFPGGSYPTAIVETPDGVIVFGAIDVEDNPSDVIIWRGSH